MTARSVESNPQDQQNPHAQPLWFERFKAALFAIPLVFIQYAPVNYGNVFAEQSPRGDKPELVRLARENAR
jgi:hypothetical protein